MDHGYDRLEEANGCRTSGAAIDKLFGPMAALGPECVKKH